MSEYTLSEEFDYWDDAGECYIAEVFFEVEEVGEWIDGVWTIYHDVKFKNADIDGYWYDEGSLTKKQIEDWTDYVRNKLDEEYSSW